MTITVGDVSERRAPESADSADATARIGMIVFLVSDVMMFAAFFAAYYLIRSNNQPWPPQGVELNLAREGAATAALVASSLTLVAGERAARRSDRPQAMVPWLVATVALGGAFLINQLAEYATLPFGPSSHVYGSTYWGLTGLHSLHVTVGLLALTLLGVRAARATTNDKVGTWREGIGLFWHLVDVVWILVFVTIWLVR